MILLLVSLLLFQQGGDVIPLPAPEFTNKSLEECIQARRSIRSYVDKGLTHQQIANILWAAQGITDTARELRAVPSAGATYPLELLIAANDGLFRYIPETHALKKIHGKDLRKDIARASLSQSFMANAGIIVIITAVYERTTLRYGKRGERYIEIEAGHCAQNIHLEAVALGLGSVPIGAYDDDAIADILNLKSEVPLYIIPVGIPAR